MFQVGTQVLYTGVRTAGTGGQTGSKGQCSRWVHNAVGSGGQTGSKDPCSRWVPGPIQVEGQLALVVRQVLKVSAPGGYTGPLQV